MNTKAVAGHIVEWLRNYSDHSSTSGFVVGISGGSLARFERGRQRLTREQKIDIAGRWLKRQMEAGLPLDSRSLYIQDDELAHLANELDFTRRGSDETL